MTEPASNEVLMKLECIALLSAQYGITRQMTAYECAVRAMSDVIWAIKVNRLPQLHSYLIQRERKSLMTPEIISQRKAR